jgi:ATP-dependent exoDNAse (exonuclease V) alpha subunit
VVRLTEVFRQAAQSRIITTAHRINQGLIPDLSPPGIDTDFYFVQAEDPEIRAGPACLNRLSASISGASAGIRPPRGAAEG